MKRMLKRVSALFLCLILVMTTLSPIVHANADEAVGFGYESNGGAFLPESNDMIPMTNALGVSNELFESFEHFIMEHEMFNAQPEGRRTDTIDVYAIQMEALQTLDFMGVTDVNRWLEDTTVDLGSSLVMFNPETGEERVIVDGEEVLHAALGHRMLDMEILALRQKLLAPWSTQIGGLHDSFTPFYGDLVEPASIIDSRLQRVPVSSLHTFPYNGVVSLTITGRNGVTANASGFIVRHPRHEGPHGTGGGVVLTVGHNLFNPVALGGWATNVVVTTSTGSTFGWRDFGVEGRWLSSQNFEWDLGAVYMDRNHSSYLTLTPMQSLSPLLLNQASVRNIGFPGERVATPNTMHRTTGTITHVYTNRRIFHYNAEIGRAHV